MAFLLVPLAVLAAGLVVLVGLYNGLVRARNACDEAFGLVDTELRRRHDLVPNLVETVRGYAAHERATLERVTAARGAAAAAHASPADLARDENALSGSLRQLFALAERYPALKADANFARLQQELAATEDRLQRARAAYNARARELNDRAQTFPGTLVAGPFGFQPRGYIELDEPAARAAPKVAFG